MILLGWSLPAGANTQLDSLRQELELAATDTSRLNILHQLIGQTLFAAPNEALAFAWSFDSLAVRQENIKWNAQAKNNLGLAYYASGKYAEAIEQYLEALLIWEELRDTIYIGKTYMNIGASYQKRQKEKETMAYFRQALGYFSNWYEVVGKPVEALDYYKQFVAVRDTLFNREQDSRMVEMLTKYEAEKKEQEISLLSSQNQIKSLQLQKANRQKLFLLLGFVAIALIAGAVYYAFIVNRRVETGLRPWH